MRAKNALARTPRPPHPAPTPPAVSKDARVQLHWPGSATAAAVARGCSRGDSGAAAGWARHAAGTVVCLRHRSEHPGAGGTSFQYGFGFGSGISADRPVPVSIAASADGGAGLEVDPQNLDAPDRWQRRRAAFRYLVAALLPRALIMASPARAVRTRPPPAPLPRVVASLGEARIVRVRAHSLYTGESPAVELRVEAGDSLEPVSQSFGHLHAWLDDNAQRLGFFRPYGRDSGPPIWSSRMRCSATSTRSTPGT